VRIASNSSGDLINTGQIALGIGTFRAGIGHDQKASLRVNRSPSGVSELIFPTITMQNSGPWQFVCATYAPGTGASKLFVNDVSTTGTLTTTPLAASGNLRIGGGSFGWSGGMARLGVFNRVLTDDEIAWLRGTFAVGRRWYEINRYRPAIWASAVSWFACDDAAVVSGATTFVDKKGVGNASGGNAQRDATFAVDPVVDFLPGYGTVGGADTSVYLKAGGRYTWPGITRAGFTLGSYGDPQLPMPLVSNFTQSFTGAWTLDTGTTYYRASATETIWLKKIGENTFEEFSQPLRLQNTIANVRSNPGTFTWSSADGGRVYLNVGDDPETVSPAGWEGAPATSTAMASSAQARGDNVRVDGLNIIGYGMTKPGQASGYGLQFFLPTSPQAWSLQAATNCDFAYTGYHCLGFIQDVQAVGLSRNNRMGLMTIRNPDSSVRPTGDGTSLVYFVGGATPGNECLSDGDQFIGAFLADWINAPAVGQEGLFAHDNPALMLVRNASGSEYYGTRVAKVAGVGSDGTTITTALAWGIGITSDVIDCSQVGRGAVLIGCTTTSPIPSSGAGYMRSVGGIGDGPRWHIGTSVIYDVSGEGGTVAFYGNKPVSGGVSENWINSYFGVVNAAAKTITIDPSALPTGNAGQTYLNTILTSDGSVPVALGVGTTAANLNTCGFFGVTSTGTTSPVVLALAPTLLDRPQPGDQLYAAGNATGAPTYDAFGDPHRGGTPIGPLG
jgi:hypothetical protein